MRVVATYCDQQVRLSRLDHTQDSGKEIPLKFHLNAFERKNLAIFDKVRGCFPRTP